ncbi:MAG: hypothetical protein QM831_39985 [Kofleriaceae bacterium]
MKYVLLMLAACSYEHPADVPNGGSGTTDGRPATSDGKPADAKPCNAKADYETTDITNQTAQNQTAGSLQQILWSATISGGEIAVDLRSKVPPFTDGIMPGEYMINDANSAGMGVELAFEFDAGDNPHDYYEADSGTIVITAAPDSTMQGLFDGMLKTVHFVHVKTDADGDPTDTVLTDCTSAVGGMTMMVTTAP